MGVSDQLHAPDSLLLGRAHGIHCIRGCTGPPSWSVCYVLEENVVSLPGIIPGCPTHNPSARKQRSDVGKFSFVNRTIADWNKLPEEIFGFPPAKVHAFSKRVKKAVERL
jgi:hypothetical protein